MKTLITGLLLCLAFAVPALAQTCTSPISGFVQASGYTFRALPSCVGWISTSALDIPHDKQSAGQLLVAVESGVVVIGAVVLSKADINATPDILQKLLHLNHIMDFVKVGVDDDGDLFVRGEYPLAGMSADDFKKGVTNVVRAAPQVYAVAHPASR